MVEQARVSSSAHVLCIAHLACHLQKPPLPLLQLPFLFRKLLFLQFLLLLQLLEQLLLLHHLALVLLEPQDILLQQRVGTYVPGVGASSGLLGEHEPSVLPALGAGMRSPVLVPGEPLLLPSASGAVSVVLGEVEVEGAHLAALEVAVLAGEPGVVVDADFVALEARLLRALVFALVAVERFLPGVRAQMYIEMAAARKLGVAVVAGVGLGAAVLDHVLLQVRHARRGIRALRAAEGLHMRVLRTEMLLQMPAVRRPVFAHAAPETLLSFVRRAVPPQQQTVAAFHRTPHVRFQVIQKPDLDVAHVRATLRASRICAGTYTGTWRVHRSFA